MPNLGAWEIGLILVIVLIVFGAGKLPDIGAGLGKAIRNFKKATSGELEESGKSKDKELPKDNPPK